MTIEVGNQFIIFGGDFSQVLLVLKYDSRLEKVNFALKYASVYTKYTKFKLTKYMRSSDVEHIIWLLAVSNDIIDTQEIPDSWNSLGTTEDIYNEFI